MNPVDAVSSILTSTGCGSTLDLFRGNSETPGTMIQWLWASPMADADGVPTHALDMAHDVVRSIDDLGFVAASEINDFFCLANDVEEAEACPFRPVACNGRHVLATGAGHLSHTPRLA